ncbi:MAG TPA: phosphoesterase, partial [Pedococcus sp.]|nr:phosphoesterase [Pedococcus sp.]
MTSTVALTVAGGGIAYAATDAFGNHTVGTQYADGLQVSDNQVIKPLGTRLMTEYGKFMGSTVSPDGRFLAASSADKSVVLQVFDLAANKLVYRVGKAAGVDQTLSDGSVGQEGPTYSP